ncbi:DUF2071 domain-containing protein [Cellulomonas sp. zg-ZUI199]|uniref:DUF2071 domain-containing protein n=1 Tax=Cellulomonas wangleii TaxID=2816956 RepID=A0ABX8D524_9CELL|nr:DUF2071 domain-containing protein [Cellulomonas wangleii]MBO0924561.1 DUF2071 domain-containing protein [Cellulomonas wangleii]QVI62544.1 DUF2071 domain-containing protein [Cellulomonas wangleii]
MSGRLPDAPIRVPVALMRWETLTFVHWAYPPQVVAAHLPPGLEPQVLDGAAWVGITPFVMRDPRVPGLPTPPAWSRFVEVNVRTYVRHPASGTDGLWFLRLLCTRPAVVVGLRAAGVPYRMASGRVEDGGDATRYRARGRDGGMLDPRVVPGARLAPDPWLVSVTGRWNAYGRRAGRLWRAPVAHPPWPLHAATVERLETDLPQVCGLPAPSGAPHVVWSPGVDVRAGAPRLLPRT